MEGIINGRPGKEPLLFDAIERGERQQKIR